MTVEELIRILKKCPHKLSVGVDPMYATQESSLQLSAVDVCYYGDGVEEAYVSLKTEEF